MTMSVDQAHTSNTIDKVEAVVLMNIMGETENSRRKREFKEMFQRVQEQSRESMTPLEQLHFNWAVGRSATPSLGDNHTNVTANLTTMSVDQAHTSSANDKVEAVIVANMEKTEDSRRKREFKEMFQHAQEHKKESMAPLKQLHFKRPCVSIKAHTSYTNDKVEAVVVTNMEKIEDSRRKGEFKEMFQRPQEQSRESIHQ